MRTLDLFRAATARKICEERNCDGCHEIYGYQGCPQDEPFNRETIAHFVQRVCEMISDRQKEETFDWEMTENELVTIIMNCE